MEEENKSTRSGAKKAIVLLIIICITLAAALEWQGELDFSKGFGTTVRGKECLWDRNTQFYILKKI